MSCSSIGAGKALFLRSCLLLLRSFGCIHCTKVNGGLEESIRTNRGAERLTIEFQKPKARFVSSYYAGVTLQSSSIRRRPNAFNLLHQLEVMVRGGYNSDSSLQSLEAFKIILKPLESTLRNHPSNTIRRHPAFNRDFEAMENAASVAAAYSVGRMEAGAASNLFTAVSAETKVKLKEMVRPGDKKRSQTVHSCPQQFAKQLIMFFGEEVGSTQIYSTWGNRGRYLQCEVQRLREYFQCMGETSWQFSGVAQPPSQPHAARLWVKCSKDEKTLEPIPIGFLYHIFLGVFLKAWGFWRCQTCIRIKQQK